MVKEFKKMINHVNQIAKIAKQIVKKYCIIVIYICMIFTIKGIIKQNQYIVSEFYILIYESLNLYCLYI